MHDQDTPRPDTPPEPHADSTAAVPAFDAKAFLATLPELPGVYRMFSQSDAVLYVGKAKNLKKRVSSYFQRTLSSPRIAHMVGQIARIETTVTRSEAEALLLENNLIKSLNPRYNILFRDDKSYPYIMLTHGAYPRLAFFRGNPDKRADYFGPFPSGGAVRESLHLLQRMFRLRTCEDSVFANRSRPCLLFQIKRCSGPCVDLVSREAYAEDVRLAALFLCGKQQEVISKLQAAMESAAAQLNFEQAAQLRDQINALKAVQEKQYVSSSKGEDMDVVVAVDSGRQLCVNLALIRGGRHLGDRPQFPSHATDCTPAEAIAAFVQQHYALHPAPARIIASPLPEEEERGTLSTMLESIVGRPLPIVTARSLAHKAWVSMAEQNAQLALAVRQRASLQQEQRLEALRDALGLTDTPQRIECFDISHTQGEAAVASCVVYQGNGMCKADYRRYNMRDITPGDDYAAMHQAVSRRYQRVVIGDSNSENTEEGSGKAPDLILIDGGKGQVASALAALDELGLTHLPMLGVAKGEARKVGLERLIYPLDTPLPLPGANFDAEERALKLPADHPALHLIQEIRDEAHRFAITGHRAQRGKARRTSTLDSIEGIGPVRRKALVAHFGGLPGVKNATIDQLMTVPGINRELAERIHASLR